MTAPTTSKANILVVDDDPFFIDLIKSSLFQHAIHACSDGSSIAENRDFSAFDLVVLDIDLDGACGYELCRELRKSEKQIPVLFASGMSDLETRLKAYGVGGNDYIAKPFERDELDYKVKVMINQYQSSKNLTMELTEASSLVRGVQTEASNLNHVNRFILHSSRCKDFDTLHQLFMHTLHELGTEGILQIAGKDPVSSNGNISRLETEIMEMSSQLPRIYSFGKGRAYYGWSNCKLLIRNVGPLIDTVAIVMDAMEICIDRIEHERKLIDKIEKLENAIDACKDGVANLFNAMTESISDELVMLGLVSSLNEDEEERLKLVMDNYNEQVQQCLSEQEAYNVQLHQTVSKMRRPHPSLETFLHQIAQSNQTSEAVELF